MLRILEKKVARMKLEREEEVVVWQVGDQMGVSSKRVREEEERVCIDRWVGEDTCDYT